VVRVVRVGAWRPVAQPLGGYGRGEGWLDVMRWDDGPIVGQIAAADSVLGCGSRSGVRAMSQERSGVRDADVAGFGAFLDWVIDCGEVCTVAPSTLRWVRVTWRTVK